MSGGEALPGYFLTCRPVSLTTAARVARSVVRIGIWAAEHLPE
jgi:hypothetical protein